ncbi:Disulphide bond corrector protein DsbC [Chitinophaga eiseniae]|uniref:Disulphide bond corrector protein DsbC n=1 Tax=Chitinophaga eiseniae TaxID=634771 RepID=A0A1T4SLN4_9BACT|nr:protein-disulfide reductase DsbD domain-containing protein [Chitinophaga eiseniae]SKA28798.1 Disulphide bond corrector protein DsbC [Chitinophaga eiseniae]
MKKISFTLMLLLTGLFTAFGHTATPAPQPIQWRYSAQKTGNGEAILRITATLADGWHLFALNNPANSPVRMAFTFLPDPDYRMEGNVSQPEPITRFEKLFGADISYFENEVVFQQKVRLTGKTATVKGNIEFTVCGPRQCLPPETIAFSIFIK